MKLSAHYNRSNIIATLSVLIIGAVTYYFAINYIIQKQLDRDLTEEMNEVISFTNLHHKRPIQLDIDEEDIIFTETDQKSFKTVFYDAPFNRRLKVDRNDNNGRAVKTLVSAAGKNYFLTITISRDSTEYLVQVIATITLLLMAGLFLILFLTNRYVSNDIWKPFFDLLRQLKAFNISEHNSFTLPRNKIDEFNELEAAIQQMAVRVKKDYKTLKQFTENASHEMMTPISVITSKLDLLIQDDSLSTSHYQQLQNIYAATSKLSRLNRSLLLLVKIENNLDDEAGPLDLEQLIIEKADQFNELIISKHITVNINLVPKPINASRHLMDMLLNNLLSNAIRHNVNNGQMSIVLTNEKLIVQNTGADHPLNEDTIFERFQKSKNSEGTGLGLAIVKGICSLYSWETSYSYSHSLHSFQVIFNLVDVNNGINQRIAVTST
jgi:signal transduction histidine kinase